MSVNGDLLHYLTIEAVSLPHMCKHDFFFLIWNSGACICYRYILMCDVRPVGISQVLLKISGPVSGLIILMSQPFKDLMHCEIILSLIQISTPKK